MTPKPFRAITFIPDQNADKTLTIKQAIWLGENLADQLLFIYPDAADVEVRQNLEQLSSEAKVPVQTFFEGSDLVDAALRISSNHDVDLLITTAQLREGLMSYYSGSIGRRLLKKADCSVMLLSPTRNFNSQCKRIVVDGIEHPKTANTIKLAHSFAKNIGADEIILATQSTEGSPESNEILNPAWNEVMEAIVQDDQLKCLKQPLNGKRGYSLSHFSQQADADFLVLNSPDTKLGYLDRVFTPELEYILTELPTNLLIVHSTQAR